MLTDLSAFALVS